MKRVGGTICSPNSFFSKVLKGEYMKELEKLNILVVGDIMLDKYLVGDVERISPEAPVPVVNVTEEYSTLGGCGNVVRNIAELGANVICLASVGDDDNGLEIHRKLEELNIIDLTINASKVTTIKERVVASYRQVQMLRIDIEDKTAIDAFLLIDALSCSPVHPDKIDMIVVSDYAKGVISYNLMGTLKGLDHKRIIVDPKPENGRLYDHVYMITPNQKEWGHMKLVSSYNLSNVQYILETKGKEGMTLYDADRHWDIPSDPVEVYNVSGAGDSVVAVMSVCLGMGLNPVISAKIANKCAGYVVTQPGTSIVPKNIFINNLKRFGG